MSTGECSGCARGLPLDGYGNHYGRISNIGPLAPYYLDLTVCTLGCWYCNEPRKPRDDCPCGAPPEMPEGFMP